jgi:hypothetical protein
VPLPIAIPQLRYQCIEWKWWNGVMHRMEPRGGCKDYFVFRSIRV